MSTYYISNLGNDENDGLSEKTPWQNISKIRSRLCGGDTLLFRRGDVFYGHFYPKAGPDKEHPTAFGAYGDERLPKPVLSVYKIANPDAFEKVGENIYRLDLTDTSCFTGNTCDRNTNVGFIRVCGKIYPHKIFEYGKLCESFDFYNDDKYVYIYCDKEPSESFADLRIACQVSGIALCDNLRVTDLCICGVGAHGINGVSKGAYIAGCEFHEIGGALLPNYPVPNTRYGNGVEFWAGSRDCTVENCKFSEIYDVAITMQGRDPDCSWENMYFIGNTMWDCQQCFEVWSSGCGEGIGFKNCHFENNVCIDSGYCAFFPARPNKTVSCPLLMYGMDSKMCDITVTGNLFCGSRYFTLYKSGGFSALPEDYKIFGNTILRKEGQPFACRAKESDEEAAAFEKKMCRDNRVFTLNEKIELLNPAASVLD